MVKTAFSDSGMVFSCFKRAKCEKFHADLRFHFLAFRLRKRGVLGFDFCKCNEKYAFFGT